MSQLPNLSEASDLEVVAQAREGRRDAYDEIVRRFHRTVFGLIHRMVRHHELAEDLTQETFIKAFRALDGGQGPDRTPSAWMLSIANSTAIDYIRRQRPDSTRSHLTVTPGYIDLRPMDVMTTPGYSPTPSTDLRQIAAAVKRAAGWLRPAYRRCFVLHWLEGRSYDEIAEMLDLPLGTVKSRTHRATEELRRMLQLAAAVSAPSG